MRAQDPKYLGLCNCQRNDHWDNVQYENNEWLMGCNCNAVDLTAASIAALHHKQTTNVTEYSLVHTNGMAYVQYFVWMKVTIKQAIDLLCPDRRRNKPEHLNVMLMSYVVLAGCIAMLVKTKMYSCSQSPSCGRDQAGNLEIDAQTSCHMYSQ